MECTLLEKMNYFGEYFGELAGPELAVYGWRNLFYRDVLPALNQVTTEPERCPSGS